MLLCKSMFCRRQLITIVTPLRRPGTANTAASVCLYKGNKKDHCSLPHLSRHESAECPQCRPIVRLRPTVGLWSPIPGIRSAIASLCRAAHLLFDRCATAPETRPLSAVSRAHPARDVNRLSSGIQRGEVGIPQ